MYTFSDDQLQRLEELRTAGINPYPHGLTVTHSLQSAREMIGERDKPALELDETEVVVAGRMMLKRGKGKAGFATIQDQSGVLQIYVRKDSVGDSAFEVWKKTSLGDIVWIKGRFMRTNTGEATLKAVQFQLAVKCIESLPDKHKGFTDVEQRSRQRYLDLFINQSTRETFVLRSKAVSYIRRFFEARSYLEVETPMLQVIPGGAAARPFVTHHNALNIDMYMRIAPELFLKRLVVGGFERVFEINRNFRNEGISLQHNPEFTMLEFYQAYASWEELMTLTETLVRELAEHLCGTTDVAYGDQVLHFGRPWRRLRFAEAVAQVSGLDGDKVWDVEALREAWLSKHPEDKDRSDLPRSVGKWFEHFFDAEIEHSLIQPTFLTHFPTEISPLSRRNDQDPRIADRFELFIAGREIANGFNELNDPVDQAQRFEAQAQAKDSGDAEAMFFDADYIKALCYGLPPTAGEGIGIDRLVMLFANRNSIRDVILFPTLRPKSLK